jgi:uracil DNA glycosylase
MDVHPTKIVLIGIDPYPNLQLFQLASAGALAMSMEQANDRIASEENGSRNFGTALASERKVP